MQYVTNDNIILNNKKERKKYSDEYSILFLILQEKKRKRLPSAFACMYLNSLDCRSSKTSAVSFTTSYTMSSARGSLRRYLITLPGGDLSP